MAVRRDYFDLYDDEIVPSTCAVLSSVKNAMDNLGLKFSRWCSVRFSSVTYDPNPETHNQPYFKVIYPEGRLVIISGPNEGEKESGVFAISVTGGDDILTFHLFFIL